MKRGTGLEETRIVRPVAVAVEGRDYLYTLLRQIKEDPDLQDVQLWDFKASGSGNLGRWLELFATLHGYRETIRAIGVIQDAEDDAQNAFRSAVQALTYVGLAAPARPMEITTSRPATGILLIPHNRPSGCLEHAVIEARQPQLPLRCAEQYLDCVGASTRNENWKAKVKVHSLIAASDNPAWTLSESMAGGMWDFTHPSLRVMKDFVRLLAQASGAP
ncbi:MAG: hypothetical protein NUV77_17915 [Thermoguttaceae bacterium]|jgi:hypothetical protein|nr:hypothetical protein [Thermoguttaceae bacterium]